MKSIPAIAFFALLFCAKPTSAEGYYVMEVGLKSCGELLEDYRGNEDDARRVYAMWMSGFLSGSNSVCKKQVKVDWRGSEAYLRNFCTQHPLSSVSVGAHALRAEAGGPGTPDECK